MKTILSVLTLICVLGLSAGCHSGAVRGVGSDITKLGDHMQK
jgi:predicted small secreted protein